MGRLLRTATGGFFVRIGDLVSNFVLILKKVRRGDLVGRLLRTATRVFLFA